MRRRAIDRSPRTLLVMAAAVSVLLTAMPAGQAWAAEQAAPAPRGRMGMAYDAARGQVVLFGGAGGSLRNDTWTFDSTGWTKRAPAHRPPVRYSLGMADD